MAGQHTGDRRLDERGRKTRKNRRRAPQDAFIKHLRLSEIRDFRRSAHVGGGGQDGILKNWPQQSVGAEPLRCLIQNSQQLRSRVGDPRGMPSPICRSPQRNPRSGIFIEQEEQAG